MNLFDEILRGQGGGGGKIKPEQLPDGYPYEKVEEFVVKHIPVEGGAPLTNMEEFPPFTVGDTVIVKVDGVEYSLIAFDDGGVPVIGDTIADIIEGGGQYGWCVLTNPAGVVCVASTDNRIVSWDVSEVEPMADKFLPMLYVAIVYDGSNYTCNKTYNEVFDALNNNIPIFAVYSDRSGENVKQMFFDTINYAPSSDDIRFNGTSNYDDLLLRSDNSVVANAPA